MIEYFSTNKENQRARLLAWLLIAPITTEQARNELGIMHPAGRINELRNAGHNIITVPATDATGRSMSMACYVLLAIHVGY